MLKGIPPELSPELLKILAEMGHGDTITIGDAYFAASAMARNGQLVRADGMPVIRMLDAILQLFPLDGWAESAVTVLDIGDADAQQNPAIKTTEMLAHVRQADEKAADTAKFVDRFAFYALAKQSYAVLATGELSNYGCIILQKGVD